jgi:hypothetical protein
MQGKQGVNPPQRGQKVVMVAGFHGERVEEIGKRLERLSENG